MPGLFLIAAILSRPIVFVIRSQAGLSVFIKRAAHTECESKGLGNLPTSGFAETVHQDTARGLPAWMVLHCLQILSGIPDKLGYQEK